MTGGNSTNKRITRTLGGGSAIRLASAGVAVEFLTRRVAGLVLKFYPSLFVEMENRVNDQRQKTLSAIFD